MDILTSIHGRKLGLGAPAATPSAANNEALIVGGNAIVIDNNGTPLIISRDDLAALQQSSREVAIGAALTVTKALHNGKTLLFDTLAGSVATLPAATGSGMNFRAVVSVLATSNSHKVQVANASDYMVGIIEGTRVDTGNAVLGFAAANSGTVGTNSDTITLNRSTTGSVSKGEWLEFEDIAANTWAVKGCLSATGAAFATPFSAAV
jgi:hypothetical protein